MKTSLILLAALAAGLATAQQDSKPDTPPKAATPDAKEKDNPRTKPPRPKNCSDVPPNQQVRFHLPPAWEQEMARKRAELERKTGIVLPPPPPPKVLPPCPPAAPKTPPAPSSPATPAKQ